MGVGARTHGSEVTRLGATDLGSEVPGRAQQGILGGVDVVGTAIIHGAEVGATDPDATFDAIDPGPVLSVQ